MELLIDRIIGMINQPDAIYRLPDGGRWTVVDWGWDRAWNLRTAHRLLTGRVGPDGPRSTRVRYLVHAAEKRAWAAKYGGEALEDDRFTGDFRGGSPGWRETEARAVLALARDIERDEYERGVAQYTHQHAFTMVVGPRDPRAARVRFVPDAGTDGMVGAFVPVAS